MRAFLRFFASLRLAIVLLILLALASVLGTLIPQGRSAAEYAARYGSLAPLLERLQFVRVFQSFWFLGLLAAFALNISVCTLSRFPSKWRRARHPRVESEPAALSALKIRDKVRLAAPRGEIRDRLGRALRAAHFKVRSAGGEGSRIHLYARRGLLGLFGSDIVHAGLLVLFAGAIVTGAGVRRTDLPLAEGQTADIPGAGFALRLDKFSTEYYPNGSVKAWTSAVTVLEKGLPLRSAEIAVNHPLVHKGFSFTQMSYGFDWDAAALEIRAMKKDEPLSALTLTLKPGQKVPLGDAERTEIVAARFLPDFVLGPDNRPETRSYRLDNPAALIETWKAGTKVAESWVFAKFPEYAESHTPPATGLTFALTHIDAPQYSVLQASRDPGVPLVWIGCVLIMAGLFLAFYQPTWEFRAILYENRGGTDITAGGIATKSGDRFAAVFGAVLSAARRMK